jgi:8-oxo-dGTP diphosphatase
MVDKRFIIRVYAIIINEQKQVLISDEYVRDMFITKFPGGGLEWGEGLVDCLKREAEEEFGQSIEITGHFYTSEAFQKSVFYEESQLFSVYYLAKFKEPIRFKISQKAFDFHEKTNGSQSFRWIPVDKLTPEELTFPIDRKVTQLLKSVYVPNLQDSQRA